MHMENLSWLRQTSLRCHDSQLIKKRTFHTFFPSIIFEADRHWLWRCRLYNLRWPLHPWSTLWPGNLLSWDDTCAPGASRTVNIHRSFPFLTLSKLFLACLYVWHPVFHKHLSTENLLTGIYMHTMPSLHPAPTCASKFFIFATHQGPLFQRARKSGKLTRNGALAVPSSFASSMTPDLFRSSVNSVTLVVLSSCTKTWPSQEVQFEASRGHTHRKSSSARWWREWWVSLSCTHPKSFWRYILSPASSLHASSYIATNLEASMHQVLVGSIVPDNLKALTRSVAGLWKHLREESTTVGKHQQTQWRLPYAFFWVCYAVTTSICVFLGLFPSNTSRFTFLWSISAICCEAGCPGWGIFVSPQCQVAVSKFDTLYLARSLSIKTLSFIYCVMKYWTQSSSSHQWLWALQLNTENNHCKTNSRDWTFCFENLVFGCHLEQIMDWFKTKCSTSFFCGVLDMSAMHFIVWDLSIGHHEHDKRWCMPPSRLPHFHCPW